MDAAEIAALPPTERIRHLSEESDIKSVAVVAFRDIEDPESGGSEVHVDHLINNLSRAGLDVVLHTGRVDGQPSTVRRGNAKVLRGGGRLGVFPATAIALLSRRLGRPDGIIEIFHGLPFFTPLIRPRTPQVGFIHHVHLGTWQMLLPGVGGRIGELVESKIMPKVYRQRRVLTGAHSAKQEIAERYGFNPSRIDVIPHGIDPAFSPSGQRAAEPTVLAVARLMPQKGIARVVDRFDRLRGRVPGVKLRVVGEGPQRQEIEQMLAERGLQSSVTLLGRIPEDQLIDEYRRAWVVVSASEAEGFGLTLLEAASCGTPVVATDIPGHRDAVLDRVNGYLRPVGQEFDDAIVQILMSSDELERLSAEGLGFARRFTWQESAAGIFGSLASEATGSRP
jgi:glycosyltransferase involved in cell wall biosynthesis